MCGGTFANVVLALNESFYLWNEESQGNRVS